MAVSGRGAVAGSLFVAAAGRSAGVGRMLIVLTVAYSLPILGAALSRTLWLTLSLLFLAGCLGAAFMSANNAVLQHRVSDEVRGRVMGAYLLTWGLMPLGALPMGMVANRLGAPAAVAGGRLFPRCWPVCWASYRHPCEKSELISSDGVDCSGLGNQGV